MKKIEDKWRTIKIPDALIISCERFLNTKKAKTLGLFKRKDVIEYATRKFIDNELK